MGQTIKAICILVGLIFTRQALADEPIWSTSGLKMPESVEYDAARDRFYVSNINGAVTKPDGHGSIGLMDGNGKLIDVNWVAGLDSPKGLALYQNKLYIADVNQLVVINVENGKLIARYGFPPFSRTLLSSLLR